MVLEMIKTGRIWIQQDDIFSDIIITANETADNGPVQLTSLG